MKKFRLFFTLTLFFTLISVVSQGWPSTPYKFGKTSEMESNSPHALKNLEIAERESTSLPSELQLQADLRKSVEKILDRYPIFKNTNSVLIIVIDGSESMRKVMKGNDLFEISKNFVRDFIKENCIFDDEIWVLRVGPSMKLYMGDLSKLDSELNGYVTSDSSMSNTSMKKTEEHTENEENVIEIVEEKTQTTGTIYENYQIDAEKETARGKLERITVLANKIPAITDEREYTDIELAKYTALNIMEYYIKGNSKKNILFLFLTDDYDQPSPTGWGYRSDNRSKVEQKLKEIKPDVFTYERIGRNTRFTLYYGIKTLNDGNMNGYMVGNTLYKERDKINEFIWKGKPLITFTPAVDSNSGQELVYRLSIYRKMLSEGTEKHYWKRLKSIVVDKETKVKLKPGRYLFTAQRKDYKDASVEKDIIYEDEKINISLEKRNTNPLFFIIPAFIAFFISLMFVLKKKRQKIEV